MSYTGHIVELPIGPDGLTGTKNLSLVRPTQLIRSHGTTYENGTIEKEGGASKYNSTAVSGAPSIIAGWDWWPNTSTQHMIVMTSAGRIVRDPAGAGTFPTVLVSGLTATGVVPVFVEGGKEVAANNPKLFCFTGKNAVRVLAATGATMTTLASGPLDWTGTNQPKFGFIHEARLMAGGNANDAHRLYYSRTGSHESFTASGAGSLSIYPGEGEGLVGGMSFKGYAILWKKPKGIYAVDTTDPSVANWKVFRVTPAVGMPSPLAAVTIDNDIPFIDANASVQLMSAVQEFGQIAPRSLSQVEGMDSFIRENVALGYVHLIQGIYYAAKREAHFAIARMGNTKNTARLIVDFNRMDLPRFRWSERDTPISLWLRKDSTNIQRPMMGDDAGFIWHLDQAAKNKAGAGYVSEFQIPHLDLSHIDPKFGTMRKTGDFLELVVEPKGSWNLIVDIYWDGALKKTVYFNMGQTGSTLGSFVLDEDVLAGNAVLTKKRRITGSGRRISIVGRNANAGEDYSIKKAYLHFRTTDERSG